MRSTFFRLLLFVGVAALVGPACSSAVGAGGGGRNADVITAEEFSEVSASTAYEAIQSLRPQWLRLRPPTSMATTLDTQGVPDDEVVVYLDNVRFGGLENLRSLRSEVVQRAERINGATATQRWGTGHSAGVISITTQR